MPDWRGTGWRGCAGASGRPRGRRKAPGRPVTYGTTPAFLVHFGLDALQDLPGLDELRGARAGIRGSAPIFSPAAS